MPGGIQADDTKGLFSSNVDLNKLADAANNGVTPVKQANGNWAYTITAPVVIGTDVETGLPTKVYTVIADEYGAVITMHPGVSR
jgi:hypothetical protein